MSNYNQIINLTIKCINVKLFHQHPVIFSYIHEYSFPVYLNSKFPALLLCYPQLLHLTCIIINILLLFWCLIFWFFSFPFVWTFVTQMGPGDLEYSDLLYPDFVYPILYTFVLIMIFPWSVTGNVGNEFSY